VTKERRAGLAKPKAWFIPAMTSRHKAGSTHIDQTQKNALKMPYGIEETVN
jgi:hypothetical protein